MDVNEVTPSSVFLPGDYPGLVLDQQQNPPSCVQQTTEDYYSQEFLPNEHANWVGTDDKGRFVVSVKLSPEPGSKVIHKMLVTTDRGTKLATLNVFHKFVTDTLGGFGLGSKKSPPEDPMATYVRALASYNKAWTDLLLVTEPTFPQRFSWLEIKHPQARLTMKIGIVYAKPGQITAQEMMHDNEPSEGFWKFVNSLGRKIDIQGWSRYRGDMRPPGTAWYDDTWHGIEIIYHVAPILNKEEIRRLVGNDVFILIYFDAPEPTQFNPSGVDTFGEVPVIFNVIQPISETQYKLGFCYKRNITVFGPNPPRDPVDIKGAKEFLLTKCFNAPTIYCPPLNRLFYVPRRATLEDILKQSGIEVQKLNPVPLLPVGDTTPVDTTPKSFKNQAGKANTDRGARGLIKNSGGEKDKKDKDAKSKEEDPPKGTSDPVKHRDSPERVGPPESLTPSSPRKIRSNSSGFRAAALKLAGSAHDKDKTDKSGEDAGREPTRERSRSKSPLPRRDRRTRTSRSNSTKMSRSHSPPRRENRDETSEPEKKSGEGRKQSLVAQTALTPKSSDGKRKISFDTPRKDGGGGKGGEERSEGEKSNTSKEDRSEKDEKSKEEKSVDRDKLASPRRRSREEKDVKTEGGTAEKKNKLMHSTEEGQQEGDHDKSKTSDDKEKKERHKKKDRRASRRLSKGNPTENPNKEQERPPSTEKASVSESVDQSS